MHSLLLEGVDLLLKKHGENGMIAKTLAIGLALTLVGCEYGSEVVSGDAVSGDAESVSIKASYSDPDPQATQHCAKYEKTAVFDSVTGDWWRWVGGSNKYVFKCQ